VAAQSKNNSQQLTKKKMKKLIYLLLFVSLASASITSCTEEEVKPQTDTSNSGGSPIKE
jgi:hypothetical protein